MPWAGMVDIPLVMALPIPMDGFLIVLHSVYSRIKNTHLGNKIHRVGKNDRLAEAKRFGLLKFMWLCILSII